MLAGRVVLHLGGREFELEPGSYVRFPPGAPVMHRLENRYDTPCRYRMIGERISLDVVAREQPTAAHPSR